MKGCFQPLLSRKRLSYLKIVYREPQITVFVHIEARIKKSLIGSLYLKTCLFLKYLSSTCLKLGLRDVPEVYSMNIVDKVALLLHSKESFYKIIMKIILRIEDW